MWLVRAAAAVAMEVAMGGQAAASSRLVSSIIATIGWTMTRGPTRAKISKSRDATAAVIYESLLTRSQQLHADIYHPAP